MSYLTQVLAESTTFRRSRKHWRVSSGIALLSHLGLFAVFFFAVEFKPEKSSVPVSVMIQEPIVVEQEPPPPEREARIREDKRVVEEPPPVQEIRGGLSDSIRDDAKPSDTAPAIAQGNSADVGVDPDAANRPVPSALGEVVLESLADAPARCPLPPELQLTDAAINAGITSGQIVIDVIVGGDGRVYSAILKQGIGYGVDELAVAAAKKMSCQPAFMGGKAVTVKNKRLVWKVVY